MVEVSPIVSFEAEEITALTVNGEEHSTTMVAPRAEIPYNDYNVLLDRAQRVENMTRMVSISSKYLEFSKPGETARGVFLGFSTINKRSEDGEMKGLPVVQWLGPDGSLYCNAGVALVNVFESFDVPKGSPIEITYEGKRDRTKIFDVRILGE